MASVYDKIWLPMKVKPKPPEPMWTGRAEALNTQPYYESSQKRTAGLFHISGLLSEEGLRHTIEIGTEFLKCLIKEGEDTIHLRPVWSIIENYRVFIHEMKNLMELLEQFHPDEGYKSLAKNAQVELARLFQTGRFNNLVYQGLVIDGSPQTTVEKFIAKQLIRRYVKRGFGTTVCAVDHVIDLHRQLDELVGLYKGQMKRCASDLQHAIDSSTVFAKDDKSSSGTEETEAGEASKSEHKSQIHIMSPDWQNRQDYYFDFYWFDKDQASILEAVLEKRSELARICGFGSFAEKSVADTPFASPTEAVFLIRYLADNIRDMAINEYSIMSAIKENLDGSPMLISDVPFMRNHTINHISREEQNRLCYYLTLGGCIDGINKIFQTIFFITLDITSILADETFAPDMYKLQVVHVTWGVVSYVYLDLMKRPNKPPIVRHYAIREGKFEEDNAYLSKMQWRPTRIVLVMSLENSGFPALLTINEAESLFVEMGKLIPTFLYHFGQRYILRDLCHINVQNLFEALMRRLFYHPKIMAIIFRKYPDGEGISDDDMQWIFFSRKVLEASYLQEMILKAAMDQAIYSEYPLSPGLTNLFKKIDRTYYSVPMFDDCYMHLKDSYLVDDTTCGKFFMKLVDRAVVIQLWKRFFEKDPLDPQASDDFMMLLFDCLAITDIKQSYSQVLDMEIDLIKIGKIILDDVRESYECSLDILENVIDETGILVNKNTRSSESFAYSWSFD